MSHSLLKDADSPPEEAWGLALPPCPGADVEAERFPFP